MVNLILEGPKQRGYYVLVHQYEGSSISVKPFSMTYRTLFTTLVFYHDLLYTYEHVDINICAMFWGFDNLYIVLYDIVVVVPSPQVKIGGYCVWQGWRRPKVCGPIVGTCTSTNKIGRWIGLQIISYG